jgi:hypothetical protein
MIRKPCFEITSRETSFEMVANVRCGQFFGVIYPEMKRTDFRWWREERERDGGVNESPPTSATVD